MRRSIGGNLGMRELAALAGADQVDRKRQHAPPDREKARAAARDLRAQGLTPLDIASALHLSEGAVQDLLGESASIAPTGDWR